MYPVLLFSKFDPSKAALKVRFASLPIWSSAVLLAWPRRRQVLLGIASTCSVWTLALLRLLSSLRPLNDFPFNKYEKSISDN